MTAATSLAALLLPAYTYKRMCVCTCTIEFTFYALLPFSFCLFPLWVAKQTKVASKCQRNANKTFRQHLCSGLDYDSFKAQRAGRERAHSDNNNNRNGTFLICSQMQRIENESTRSPVRSRSAALTVSVHYNFSCNSNNNSGENKAKQSWIALQFAKHNKTQKQQKETLN